jgi:hypothetical protein
MGYREGHVTCSGPLQHLDARMGQGQDRSGGGHLDQPGPRVRASFNNFSNDSSGALSRIAAQVASWHSGAS